MAALADYLDLRFAVGDFVKNRNLSDVMPRLVQQAESKLNKELRCRQQITADTLTFANGEAPLPSDFVEMLNVYGVDGLPLTAAPLTDIQREGSQYYRYAVDGTKIYIRGLSGDRDIEYYAALPTLTTTPTTPNWLLAYAPDVYLYAASLEAAIHIQDVEKGAAARELLDGAMARVKLGNERAQWANTTTRVRGVCP